MPVWIARPCWIVAVLALSLLTGALVANVSTGRAETVADTKASAAMFTRMATVLQSPRCMNCHPAADFPQAGDDRHRHIMSVMRGPEDHGVPSLQCQACHRDVNSAETGVPGAPDWHLAPLSMAWEGLSVAQLCRSLFDPEHGGLSTDALLPHLQTPLVQWAWAPGNSLGGKSRQPPPVPRDEFLALSRAWVASGAVCPSE
jgi:hypothetical protein